MLKDTSTLVFNTAKPLYLCGACITSSALKKELVQTTSDFIYDEANERATIALPTTLPAGSNVQLRIDFESEITGALMGYYRSAWEHEGKTKHYALTQLGVSSSLRLFDLPTCTQGRQAYCRQEGVPVLGRAFSQSYVCYHPDLSYGHRRSQQYACPL